MKDSGPFPWAVLCKRSAEEFQRIILPLALALLGIGYGMYAPPNLSIVLSQYPQKQGLASSIMMTSRNLGIMAGIALFETVFSAAVQGEASIHPSGVLPDDLLRLSPGRFARICRLSDGLCDFLDDAMPKCQTGKSLTR